MSLEIINENIDNFIFNNENRRGYNATIKVLNENQLRQLVSFISIRWNNYINESILLNNVESYGLIKLLINNNVTIFCYLIANFTNNLSNKIIISPHIYYYENNQYKLFHNLSKYNSDRHCVHINWNNFALETLSPHIKKWFNISITNRDIIDEKHSDPVELSEFREINTRYHENMSLVDSLPDTIPSYSHGNICEPKQIKTLPKHIIELIYIGLTHSGKSITCPICLDNIPHELFSVTHCGHEYCKNCIDTLNRCGICRSSL
jgi:hypothetical protein